MFEFFLHFPICVWLEFSPFLFVCFNTSCFRQSEQSWLAHADEVPQPQRLGVAGVAGIKMREPRGDKTWGTLKSCFPSRLPCKVSPLRTLLYQNFSGFRSWFSKGNPLPYIPALTIEHVTLGSTPMPWRSSLGPRPSGHCGIGVADFELLSMKYSLQAREGGAVGVE